jgi:hypothetical protein
MPRTTKQRTTSAPAPATRSIPAPATKSIPAPTHTPVQSQNNSMFDTMKQGFSFGMGSAIAHRLFDPRDKNETIPKNETIIKNEITSEPKLSTDKMYELYNKCLEKNDNNIDCNVILQSNTHN